MWCVLGGNYREHPCEVSLGLQAWRWRSAPRGPVSGPHLWGPGLIVQKPELHFQGSIKPAPPPRPAFSGFHGSLWKLEPVSSEQQGEH